ncbi:hypothetical protein CM19_06080 [Candidatus Acidianus copahuensis]|uniref:Dephospho-CoA kinase n=2 Tax=Sulfolobaceae TaxID=118883 RepID=A0A031LPL3_9CREN|nr:hypothetical protein CM19_06080 [Candidatus Acidianus copahuensis]NON62172.1 AAA family ATPase [Acidianus sp. RZ1]
MPGSGKTLFGNILKERGYQVVSMGDVLRKRYEKDAKIGERLMDYAKRIREIYGDGVVARLSLEEVDPKAKRVAFEGVRSLAEVEEFARLGNPIVVSVHSPPSLRYSRLMARQRSDDSTKIEELKRRDYQEIAIGIGGVIAMADYVILNTGTIEDFKRQAEDILNKL